MLLALAVIANFSTVSAAFSQVQEKSVADSAGRFVDSTFAAGLKMPAAMEFAPDGRLFVTELDGNVRIIKDGKLDAPFANIPATSACCERASRNYPRS
ncbi:MAG: PQQ-dependent sugar dehydrogenase [Nitrososphaera sp.]